MWIIYSREKHYDFGMNSMAVLFSEGHIIFYKTRQNLCLIHSAITKEIDKRRERRKKFV